MRIELRPRPLLQLPKCFSYSHGLSIGPVARHSVEGVAREDDAAGERYLAISESVRVTLAVPGLVLGSDDGCEFGGSSIEETTRSPSR